MTEEEASAEAEWLDEVELTSAEGVDEAVSIKEV